jgi:hypothetical protein
VPLDIEAVLNDGRALFAGQHVIAFDGQSIELPAAFIEGIERCLEPLTSNTYSKTHRVGPKELWGPYGRHQQYHHASEMIDTMTVVHGHGSSIAHVVKAAIAAHIGVQQ